MRSRIALLALLLAANAGAQAPDPSATVDGSARPRQERAPLANVDNLEPAVDVGSAPVAAVPRPTPAAPPAIPATPSSRAGARVVDSLDLGTTSITGNQELPKVLYIVPWKKSDLGDLVGRPVNTLLDEVLAPVDPEVFERQLEYYETLYGDSK
ncbi:MAG TPA: hypothetical protein VJA26_08690 [Gammaproteobacteria bacterium]|nr:hypothetical protein [Gammaproteobacteria bacterium]